MIYEYIGDVISQPSFIKRMREYAEEGIRHFYFMMLQKDEVRYIFSIGPIDFPTHQFWFAIKQYIDATKRGGIGRFLNHSCAPNCYVAKWTVGNHYRMGIFANRNVQIYEELTFNYNVDRYGYVSLSFWCSYFLSDSQTFIFILAAMKHSLAIVVNRNVLDILAGKLRQILEPWMTSISKVLPHITSILFTVQLIDMLISYSARYYRRG